jgi:hypothetical protein
MIASRSKNKFDDSTFIKIAERLAAVPKNLPNEGLQENRLLAKPGE